MEGLAVVGEPHVGTTSSDSVGYEVFLPRLAPKNNEVEELCGAPRVSSPLRLVKSAVFGRFSSGKLTAKTLWSSSRSKEAERCRAFGSRDSGAGTD